MNKFSNILRSIIYNEIIEKKDFGKDSKYRKEVKSTFNSKKWIKAFNKYTKPLFTTLNNGTFKRTIVIPFDSDGSSSGKYDIEEMKRFIRSQGYKIDNDVHWNLGLVTKTKEGDTKVLQVAKSYIENIKKNYQKLEDQKDKLETEIKGGSFEPKILESKKKKIEEIKEQQSDMKKFEDVVSKYVSYSESSDNKYSMVFSLDPRAIASQSTKTAWQSCMNLDGGINKHYVGSGIAAGTFVVFLALNEDAKSLNGPVARVLVKPFFSEDKVFWYTDQVYPRGTNAAFRTAVAKILKTHNMKSQDGQYKLPSGVYDDGVSEVQIDDVYRYAEVGDFSDIMNKDKDFIEKMFDKHAVKVLQNWPKGKDFPDITVKNLDASGTDIRYFPKGIKVTGNLNLSGTNIEKIFT